MRLLPIPKALRSQRRISPPTQHQPKRSQSRELRRLFLVFCAALLLESVALQLITTADGSEVAFNPDPILTEPRTSPSATAIGSVAGISTTQQSQASSASDNLPEQEAASFRSLVTHAQAAAPPAPLNSPALVFHQPLPNYTLTQYFSSYHTAIDLAAPTGTPVYATTEGVVVSTGYLLPGGGLMIKVEHDGGYSSYYAHLSAITVQGGQRVTNSTQIGRVGSTGWATGPHLHFMIWKNQQALNPLSLLK